MRKFVFLLIVVAAVCGCWFLFQNYQIRGLDLISFAPRGASDAGQDQDAAAGMPSVARQGPMIRIASFNIQVFGEKKLNKPRVRGLLAEIIRGFDIVAIQEIRSKQDIMPQFVDAINSTGRHYDYVVGPRLGRTSSKEQYAFVYDTASIEVCIRLPIPTICCTANRWSAGSACAVLRRNRPLRFRWSTFTPTRTKRDRNSTRWPMCFWQSATTGGAKTT